MCGDREKLFTEVKMSLTFNYNLPLHDMVAASVRCAGPKLNLQIHQKDFANVVEAVKIVAFNLFTVVAPFFLLIAAAKSSVCLALLGLGAWQVRNLFQADIGTLEAFKRRDIQAAVSGSLEIINKGISGEETSNGVYIAGVCLWKNLPADIL